MIEIKSNSRVEKLDNILKSSTTISLDTGLIKSDISKFMELKAKKSNRVEINNISNIIKYLNNIISLCKSNNSLSIKWKLKNDILYSEKVYFLAEPLYNLDSINYISTEKDQMLLKVDTTNLADILAFSLTYNALGEEVSDIENILEDATLIGINDSKLLTEYIRSIIEPPNTAYDTCKALKVEKRYIGEIVDYFALHTYKDKTYTNMVKTSIKYANQYILNSICYKLDRHNIKYNLISLTSKNIDLLINKYTQKEKLMDIVNGLQPITIKLFGRNFNTDTKINII